MPPRPRTVRTPRRGQPPSSVAPSQGGTPWSQTPATASSTRGATGREAPDGDSRSGRLHAPPPAPRSRGVCHGCGGSPGRGASSSTRVAHSSRPPSPSASGGSPPLHGHSRGTLAMASPDGYAAPAPAGGPEDASRRSVGGGAASSPGSTPWGYAPPSPGGAPAAPAGSVTTRPRTPRRRISPAGTGELASFRVCRDMRQSFHFASRFYGSTSAWLRRA